MPHCFLSLLFTALFLTTAPTSAAATIRPAPSPAPATPTIIPNTSAATPTISPAHTPTLSPHTSNTTTLVPTSSPAPSPPVISKITTTTITTAAPYPPQNLPDNHQQLGNKIDTLVGATPTLSPAHTPTLSPHTFSPAPSPYVISNITTTTVTAAPHPSHKRQQLRNISDALVGATPTLSPAHISNIRTFVPSSSPAPSPLVISNVTTTTVITAVRHPPHNLPGNRQQIRNIIDALVGAGDFNIWANVLAMADPSTLPLSATLFIPADDSRFPIITTTITIDPYIFPYHIVPQRLSFSELGQFKLYSRLPTLLAAKSILITNNSVSNYTLDGSLVSHPDLYANGNIVVHGITTLLDYSVYGEDHPKPSQPEVLSRPPSGEFVSEGELINDHPVTNSACALRFGLFLSSFVLFLHQRFKECALAIDGFLINFEDNEGRD